MTGVVVPGFRAPARAARRFHQEAKMEIAVVVKWKVKPSEIDRVLALLPELAAKTRAEPGNLFYSIFQSESEPGELFLVERYANADAASAHRQSEHYRRIVAGTVAPLLDVREVTSVKTLQ
jgi:quinol monooxygenase YgiN